MNQDEVEFTIDKPLLGDGCDVIAVFRDGRKKRIVFGSESAARDWMRQGAARWLKKRNGRHLGKVTSRAGDRLSGVI